MMDKIPVIALFGAEEGRMNAELIEWLDRWQTLVGSALGGVVGLLAALVVANSASRREELSAAMVLAGNLVKIVGAYEVVRDDPEGQRLPAGDRHLWLAEKLAKLNPTLSPLFEPSLVRIMPVNGALACHLELFRMIYVDLEGILERIRRDYDEFRKTGAAPRSKAEMQADAQRAASGFEVVVLHAKYADDLLSKFILGKLPTFNRLRWAVWKTGAERKGLELLQTGEAPNKGLQADLR